MASKSHSTVVSELEPWPRGGIHIRVQFLLVGPLEEPYTGIPLPRQRVTELGDWMCREGINPLKKAIGVAVNSADFPVDAHKGSLLVIMPEEQAHAILLKVAVGVRQGPRTTHSGGLCC